MASLVTIGVTVSAAVGFAGSATWAGWFGSVSAGGVGSAVALGITDALAPTISGTGGEIVISWPAATLGSTNAIKSYTVKRYSGEISSPVTGACAGSVDNIGCVELNVPAGTWTYTVTPVLSGTSWVGKESPKSAAITTTGVVSNNSLWFWVAP